MPYGTLKTSAFCPQIVFVYLLWLSQKKTIIFPTKSLNFCMKCRWTSVLAGLVDIIVVFTINVRSSPIAIAKWRTTWRHNKTGIVLITCHSGAFRQPLWPWKSNILYILKVSETLFIQHAKRMHCITLSSVAYLTLPYFSTLSHNGTIFDKKVSNI